MPTLKRYKISQKNWGKIRPFS